MKYKEAEAPAEFLKEISNLETEIDKWNEGLDLLRDYWDAAVYAAQTFVVAWLEVEIIPSRGYASRDHSDALVNLALSLAVLLEKLNIHCPKRDEVDLRWGYATEQKAKSAVDAASNYMPCTLKFPLWHRNRLSIEKVGPKHLRFIASEVENDRRVSAYQKGFRPPDFVRPPSEVRGTIPLTPSENLLTNTILATAREDGRWRFKYGNVEPLWTSVFASYQERLHATFRRDRSLNLGGYSLEQFTDVYAGIATIAGVHEHLCFGWRKMARTDHPVMSATLVWFRSKWLKVLSSITNVSAEQVDKIIRDLTFGRTRRLDMHVHPFVALDTRGQILSLLPAFLLHSRADENILRVLSHVENDAFSQASAQKEREFLREVRTLPLGKYLVGSSIKLPQPLPDIDALFVDSNSSTLLICELKWVRKPFLSLERFDRDADFLKGLNQLRDIRNFISREPDYLQTQGLVFQPVSGFARVQYLLVARDHFMWMEPESNLAAVEYEAFIWKLNTLPLAQAVDELLTYTWLPTEGKDYEIRLSPVKIKDVVLESERFFPRGSREARKSE